MTANKFKLIKCALTALASFALALNASAQYYNEYVDSNSETYSNSFGLYFYAGWKSANDTVNTEALYLQNRTSEGSVAYDIDSLTVSTPMSLRVNHGANVTISNSNLALNDRIYVQSTSSYDPSSLLLKNCTTTFSSANMSQVMNGSSLVVDGGKFTVSQAGEEIQALSVKQGSTLEFKNADVDMRGVRLQTDTDSSFRDKSATITIDNSTFKAGFIDMYGYTSSGAMPVINITNGSNFTGSFFREEEGYYFDGTDFVYGTITTSARGGTINVSGENTVFNVSEGFIQAETSASGQVYTTVLNISDGGKANINGALDVSSVTIDNASVTADSIVVSADRDMTVTGASTVETDMLTVHEGSTLSLEEAVTLDIAMLEVILSSELAEGTEFDLNNIFGDATGIVLSGVENNVFIGDSEGNLFEAIISENGVITAGTPIPEPSTYAAIFGILALGIAAWRKRK